MFALPDSLSFISVAAYVKVAGTGDVVMYTDGGVIVWHTGTTKLSNSGVKVPAASSQGTQGQKSSYACGPQDMASALSPPTSPDLFE